MDTPRQVAELPVAGPFDEQGRLLHDGDPAAQLALAVSVLEARLAATGHPVTDLARIHIRTVNRRALDGVYDVLTERLEELGADPLIDVTEADRLGEPGTLLTLQATITLTKEPVMTTTSTPSADTLRGLCGGRVLLPGDPGYDEARTPWNLAVDQRPAAVALPRTAEEVAEVVRAAAAAGLRVAPQSTGHGAAGLKDTSLEDAVLVKLSELTGVTVDAAAGTARVLGGTQWAAVVGAAEPHGFTALHGSAPDVAVAGYVLGGGASFYGRQHGLASGSVLAIELVTADGTLVRCDADHEPDLFWALRGGGGNFGVVVAIELRLIPMADVFAGMLLWDRERAPEVCRAWAAWTKTVPESVTTSMRVMSFPPLPELPPFLSGRQLVIIDGAVLESDERAAELLAPLRALQPEMDTFARIPVTAMTEVHMDPPTPVGAVGEHAMLSDVTDETIEALLGQVGPGTTSPLMFGEIRHLGGALGRPDPAAGAASHLAGDYLAFCVAPVMVPEMVAPGEAASREFVAALQPWANGRSALNFTDNPGRVETGYDSDTLARLREVRRSVDPTGVFVANHAL